jgi:hypothetical protein
MSRIPIFHSLVVMLWLLAGIAGAGRPAPPLESLRIRHQLEGWYEEKEGYIPFNHEKLFELINGGAPEYIDAGLVGGFLQRLSGPGEATVELFAHDFGTPEKARTMFLVKTGDRDTTIMLTGFDTATVVVVPVLSASVAYGAIGRFFFEVTVSGTGNRSDALPLLDKLFRFYAGISTLKAAPSAGK